MPALIDVKAQYDDETWKMNADGSARAHRTIDVATDKGKTCEILEPSITATDEIQPLSMVSCPPL